MDDFNSDMAKKKNKGAAALPFKDVLSQVMRDRNLTLKQVAALSDVSVSVVQNWIEGKTPYDLLAVDRLAQKLGIPFKKLLLGVAESVDAPNSLMELYDESDLFEGLCKVQIKKLTPKKDKT